MPNPAVRSALFVIVLLLSNLLASQAHAEQIPVSLNDALTLFYQRNLDLLAAQYNIDQAKADEVIASAIPNPTVGFQLSELANNLNKGSNATGCSHDPNVSCGPAEYFSFSQLIEMAGKRGLRMEGSGFATQAAESDFKDALRIFSNMVRDAYYDLLQAQKNRWLAQEIVDHYYEITQANTLRLKSGDIAESDFLRVRMEAMRAQSDLDVNQAAVEQAQAAFAMILRWPEKGMQFVAQEEWPDSKALGANLAADELVTQAMRKRPDLQADKQRKAQSEKELELARRLKYPDVTLTAGYARDPSNNALNSGFVGVSIPVPLFYQYQGESDKAAVAMNQSQLAIEQTEMSIRSEVVSALATWTSTDKIVQRFKEGLLDDALAVRNSSELAYSKGATGVLDFIEAQRSYKNIMHDYYAALINRANAYYDLAKALGVEPGPDKPARFPATTLE
ncbi:TolC family protein [Methylomonas methanica]|uniref:Outer membrane efflux protein n=1 Tax=Methylomonas methanica (strain DSM 25384 / MC09) TaxID=857087 RepID=F9ZV05_METMM|nr:TolC family protein [Methylomonas methanica]AEF99438.1 outer membrane efflux protein [Methylomonas methanica MC09]